MGHITVRAKAIRDLCNKIFFLRVIRSYKGGRGTLFVNFCVLIVICVPRKIFGLTKK